MPTAREIVEALKPHLDSLETTLRKEFGDLRTEVTSFRKETGERFEHLGKAVTALSDKLDRNIPDK